jgi:hypothetical protein
MAQLTLIPEEAAALRDMLSSSISDLRMEIAATDSRAFREDLKRLKVLLIGLLEQLDSELVAPAASF